MDFTAQEQAYIVSRFEKMLTVCTRCKGNENIERVRKAFEFAHKAHFPTRRKSGEPYILHPISVAQICGTELNLGTTSIIAALLHDVVEDTEVTVEDIKANFGEEIATMVDGLTKISGAISLTNSMQSENFKKILLTMAQDIRVILIKLADRLHNIRTLDSMPRHKQLKIASETFYIFAPIAHRLGLYAIKTELEDNAFKIKQPTEFAEIEQKLKNTDVQRTIFINKFSLPIAARLTEKRYDFDISGRPKSMYSIYQKMVKKAVPFEEIYDLFAIRIIFTPKENDGSEKEQCFKIYSVVTDIYTPRPDRLRDWVTTPKENGYEALHSTVMGPGGKWVEVQIRTRRMDEVAEYGYAAHFKYKGNQTNERSLESWLNFIRETMRKADPDAIDFVESVKSALTTSEIVVFTPKGDNYSFPYGATALDFAFAVHPNIGHKAISAKVNHLNMPLNYKLRNGDQIEILTSQKQKPQPNWLEIVKTAKARNYLKKYLNQEIDEQAATGKDLLEKMLDELKLSITPRIIEKVKIHYQIAPEKEDKYALAQIAQTELNLETLKKILRQNTPEKKILFWTIRSKENSTKKSESQSATTKEDYSMANCCRPLPGDPVQGFKMQGNTIIIHHINCPEAIKLSSQFGNKIVEVDWFSKEQKAFLSELKLSGIDRMGLVNDITTVLSKELSINIRSINFYSHDGIFEGTIELYVRSTEDLKDVMAKLKKISGVDKVLRPI